MGTLKEHVALAVRQFEADRAYHLRQQEDARDEAVVDFIERYIRGAEAHITPEVMALLDRGGQVRRFEFPARWTEGPLHPAERQTEAVDVLNIEMTAGSAKSGYSPQYWKAEPYGRNRGVLVTIIVEPIPVEGERDGRND